MLSLRTLLFAVVATFLAAFPAGFWLASAPVGVTASQAESGFQFVRGGTAHLHDMAVHYENVRASVTAEPEGDACMHHASGGNSYASNCCGFACHALELALPPGLMAYPSRTSDCCVVDDEQVDGCTPLRIERPPRAA